METKEIEFQTELELAGEEEAVEVTVSATVDEAQKSGRWSCGASYPAAVCNLMVCITSSGEEITALLSKKQLQDMEDTCIQAAYS